MPLATYLLSGRYGASGRRPWGSCKPAFARVAAFETGHANRLATGARDKDSSGCRKLVRATCVKPRHLKAVSAGTVSRLGARRAGGRPAARERSGPMRDAPWFGGRRAGARWGRKCPWPRPGRRSVWWSSGQADRTVDPQGAGDYHAGRFICNVGGYAVLN